MGVDTQFAVKEVGIDLKTVAVVAILPRPQGAHV